ncbi:unnamed protein product [Urochloa humidicola]
MKPATVALLILVNMMFTFAYFGHASSHETEAAAETTLLSNSHGSNDESSFAGGMTLGRKLGAETSINSAAVSTDSSRSPSIDWYTGFISHPPRRP